MKLFENLWPPNVEFLTFMFIDIEGVTLLAVALPLYRIKKAIFIGDFSIPMNFLGPTNNTSKGSFGYSSIIWLTVLSLSLSLLKGSTSVLPATKKLTRVLSDGSNEAIDWIETLFKEKDTKHASRISFCVAYSNDPTLKDHG